MRQAEHTFAGIKSRVLYWSNDDRTNDFSDVHQRPSKVTPSECSWQLDQVRNWMGMAGYSEPLSGAAMERGSAF